MLSTLTNFHRRASTNLMISRDQRQPIHTTREPDKRNSSAPGKPTFVKLDPALILIAASVFLSELDMALFLVEQRYAAPMSLKYRKVHGLFGRLAKTCVLARLCQKE